MADTYTLGEKEIDGIKLKNVRLVHYDPQTDIIIIVFDTPIGGAGQRHYGAKARELANLLNGLQEYWRTIHAEREKVFKVVWARMDRAQDEGLTE